MLKLNTRDTVSLSPQFFDVIDRGEDYILLVSKFTSHKWKLVYSNEFISIYHAHSVEDNLHYQTSCLDVYNYMLYILDHEDYQLNDRKRERRIKTDQQNFCLAYAYLWASVIIVSNKMFISVNAVLKM